MAEGSEARSFTVVCKTIGGFRKEWDNLFVYAVTYKQRFPSPQSDGDLTSEISALRGFLLRHVGTKQSG